MSDLTTFMSLSGCLLGVPNTWLKSLDDDLGAKHLERLNQYLASWTSGNRSSQIPPLDESTTLSPQTMTDLLQTWQGIASQGGDPSPEVDRQIFGKPDLSALAQKVVILWYTNKIDDQPGSAKTYDRAQVWAVSYAHPQAVPRAFGYWQYPPQLVQEQEEGSAS